jgi:hypothetical protein
LSTKKIVSLAPLCNADDVDVSYYSRARSETGLFGDD